MDSPYEQLYVVKDLAHWLRTYLNFLTDFTSRHGRLCTKYVNIINNEMINYL